MAERLMRAVEVKRICYLHNHLQRNTNINIQNSTGAIKSSDISVKNSK